VQSNEIEPISVDKSIDKDEINMGSVDFGSIKDFTTIMTLNSINNNNNNIKEYKIEDTNKNININLKKFQEYIEPEQTIESKNKLNSKTEKCKEQVLPIGSITDLVIDSFDKLLIDKLMHSNQCTKEYPELQVKEGEEMHKKFIIRNPETFDKNLKL